jgi:GNAT superfamily N-acetyltransferase
MATQPKVSRSEEPVVRPLQQSDLQEADQIFRLAFGTFLGIPDPSQFFASTDFVRGRLRANPEAAFGVELNGELVGSNFATNWGSVGFFGPLTIRPELWDRGLAQRLLIPVMEVFQTWNIRHAGLFTFAQSAKHLHLYQKFGFWPRFLTVAMAKPVQPKVKIPEWNRFSDLAEDERENTVRKCKELADSVYEGLDLTREILAVNALNLGETVLVSDADNLAGMAVCHCGPGTEAGQDTCYVKFAAAHPGPKAAKHFERLLDACEELARSRGLSKITAGVNLGRHKAYRKMLARGFRAEMQGVAMHRPNEPGYSRPGVYAIDDWR